MHVLETESSCNEWNYLASRGKSICFFFQCENIVLKVMIEIIVINKKYLGKAETQKNVLFDRKNSHKPFVPFCLLGKTQNSVF